MTLFKRKIFVDVETSKEHMYVWIHPSRIEKFFGKKPEVKMFPAGTYGKFGK